MMKYEEGTESDTRPTNVLIQVKSLPELYDFSGDHQGHPTSTRPEIQKSGHEDLLSPSIYSDITSSELYGSFNRRREEQTPE
jgi:hypothetical protein